MIEGFIFREIVPYSCRRKNKQITDMSAQQRKAFPGSEYNFLRLSSGLKREVEVTLQRINPNLDSRGHLRLRQLGVVQYRLFWPPAYICQKLFSLLNQPNHGNQTNFQDRF